MIKRLLSYCLLFLHTFVQAQVPFSHPDASQDFCIGCKSFETFIPKQLTLLSEGEIGVGALASELRSYQGGGDNWRKDVRITHRLTQAEVGNLLIATPDNLKLTGVEVTGTSAKIQLGGGYLADSPQDVYHHSHHTESDGWFSSSSEDVSYTVQTTRRNVLNVEATTLSAGLFLDRGGDYRGHTHVTSPKAQLEAVLDKLERMESSTDSNLFFKSGENRGEIRHTPVLTRTENLTLSTTRARVDILPGGAQPGWLKLEPFDPAALQVPQINASLADFSSRFLLEPGDPAAPARPMLAAVEPELESEPELQLSPQPAQDPELTLHPVQGAYEHWDQSYFGLTPGFAAVVALAVTIATGGTGGPAAQAATAMGFGAEGAVFLAAKAGIQAVAASTVVGTLNHQGNVFKAVEDLGKPDSLRAIAASIVTAGLVEDITHTLKLPDVPKTFGEHFQHAAIKGAVSLPVNTALGGVDPDKALGAAALGVAANTMGGFAATKIGQAYGAESLSYAEHKALHAGLGAITGAILDPSNPGKGALAGALGAITSEMLAEAISGNPQEMATRVLGEVAERAALEGRGFSQKEYETALKEAAEVAKNVGQIGAAGTALLAKQEVATAIHTAQTATENNLVPGLIAGGLFVWSAYEIMEIARTQGKDAALKAAGIEIGTFVVGGVLVKGAFKVGKVAYKSAEAAWAAYVAENPIMAKIGNAINTAAERGKSWIGRGVGKTVTRTHPDGSVWLEGPVVRGEKIEQALGQNLHKNYPVIDRFDNGVVTSIKSIDLNAKTYQDAKKLQRTLEKYVDKVADFRGDRFARKEITSEEIRLRALDLAIPHSGNPAQQQVFRNLVDYAKSKGVTVNSIIFQ